MNVWADKQNFCPILQDFVPFWNHCTATLLNIKGEGQGNRCAYDAFEQLVSYLKPCKEKTAKLGGNLGSQRTLMGFYWLLCVNHGSM